MMKDALRESACCMLAIAVAGSSALAADVYRVPEGAGGYKDGPAYVAGWSGFYAGVNGGYAFDARDRHAGILDEGGFGGGQIGYNWQGILHPRLVLGIEADIQGTGIDQIEFLMRVLEQLRFKRLKFSRNILQ